MTSLVRKRAHAFGALVLVLTACGTSPPQGLPVEDRLLERLMEDYVSERFRFYPVESTRAGLPGEDDRLGSFSREDIERRVAWLTDFHHKLLGLKLDALSQPAYLDALWLTSLVKAEILELDEIRLWERSVSFYAEPIRTGLTSLLLDPDVASRTGALGGRLDEIPGLVEHARENLVLGASLRRSEGLVALELCLELLNDLPQLLADRIPSYQIAGLAEKSRIATRSLRGLVDWVRSGGASGERAFIPLGAAVLERYLLYAEMVDGSADELLAEVSDAIRGKTNALTALALAQFSGAPLPTLVGQREVPVDLRETVESAEAGARALGEELGRPFPLPQPVPVVTVARYFVAPDVLRLFRPAALEPTKGPFLIVDVGASVAGERALQLRTLGEIAMRYRLFAYQGESTSLLRRVFSTRSTTEGLVAWGTSRLIEDGYGGAELELRDVHESLLQLVRLAAIVELHARGKTIDEAARLFQERAFLAPRAARREAERAALDLRLANAGLGRLRLGALERDYSRARPLDNGRTLVQRILAEGPLPLRLLRYRLLGLDSGA